MSELILYHGSPNVVVKPMYGQGRRNNDYGQGFYCTEDIELAKEWVCAERVDGYANHYTLDTTDLRVLNLSSDEYSILNWLAILLNCRGMRLDSPLTRRGKEYTVYFDDGSMVIY